MHCCSLHPFAAGPTEASFNTLCTIGFPIFKAALITPCAQGSLSDVTAYHFLPPGRTHHVTALYPRKSTDAELNEAKLTGHRWGTLGRGLTGFVLGLWGVPTAAAAAAAADAAALAQDVLAPATGPSPAQTFELLPFSTALAAAAAAAAAVHPGGACTSYWACPCTGHL
eukprot:1160075-Pelagomonas_calceolata.AAC.1